MSVPTHFSSNGINYAASNGVPYPQILVPISGILAGLGGLSILLGYRARIGATLIALFLIPVTLLMHHFWTIGDPMQRQIQASNFLKNLSLLGGALYIMHTGSGPMSVDSAIRRHDVTHRYA